ncbi:MAG: ABC transporter ATP-binding protein [Clostridium sp.]
MRNYYKYIRKYWKPFLVAICCLTIESMCDLMQPTIMSKIIDIGVSNKEMDYVLKMGGIMLCITGLGAISAVMRNILSSNVSQKFGCDLRCDIFEKIQGLSISKIEKYNGASLVVRLTNDVTQVQNFVLGLMRVFVKAPLICIGSIIMAININPKMSLVFLIVIPIVGVLIAINMKIGYPFFMKIQDSLDNLNSIAREYLGGVRVVKAFNRFSYEKRRFEDSNEELTSISAKTMGVMAVFSPGITFVVNLGIVAIIWIGGLKVNSGNMQVGQVIAFVNYMTQILFALMMISFVFNTFIKAKASASRISEVLGEDINEEKYYKKVDNNTKGKIDLENISFSYCDDIKEPVLKNISFSCNTGETVGIIGSTGSGKSTIATLIEGFYPLNIGKIKINNIDIKNMDIKNLREKISIVPQKVVLFSGTVMDNIKVGKEKATLEEIIEAAKVAKAHDFIEALPNGYNTILGQGGVNLSGGQKQRISIARALIRKPEILILDDCTSAVDVVTEIEIREGIENYSKNLTCIIIAQRITSVMDAHKIIVLHNGIVVGNGSHKELILECEVYKDIFISQIGKENM